MPCGPQVGAVRTGNLVFVGGHSARMPEGSMRHPGKVGQEVTIERGMMLRRGPCSTV